VNIRNEPFYRTLVEHSPDPILVLGPDLRVVFSTLKDMEVMGLPGVEPMGTSLLDYASVEYRDEMAGWLERVVADPERAHRFEFEGRQRIKGGRHLVAVARNLRRHPAVQGIVVTLQDVTTQRRAEMEARLDAMYDSLTGFARREFFSAQMHKAVAHAARHGEFLAVLFVDVDGFKAVNDALGHDAGDRILKEISVRLRDTLRSDDTIGRGQLLENEDRIARRGGDEFTIMLTKLGSPVNSALVAQRMLDAVAFPYSIDGKEVTVTISIGIAVFPQHGRSVEELIRNADTAMYAAKKQGKNIYRFHAEP